MSGGSPAEIRRHPITGDPVIFAPRRSHRPNAEQWGTASRAAVPSYDASCPFCPGHEAETPPTTFAAGDPWRVRVFPNKYPFAEHHEVIVESARHDATFAAIDHAADVIAAYVDRAAALEAVDEVVHVCLFKNHGRRAGASLSHLHSQIVGLPVIPPRIERELRGFRSADRCPLCDGIAGELLAENESMVSVAPFGRSMPHEVWIIPRRHHSSISQMRAAEIPGLAAILQDMAASLDPLSHDHNWLVQQFCGERSAHWYVSLVPRTAPVAGFELSTGMFVDSTGEHP